MSAMSATGWVSASTKCHEGQHASGLRRFHERKFPRDVTGDLNRLMQRFLWPLTMV